MITLNDSREDRPIRFYVERRGVRYRVWARTQRHAEEIADAILAVIAPDGEDDYPEVVEEAGR